MNSLKSDFLNYTIAGDLSTASRHYQNGSDGRSYFILNSYSNFASAVCGTAALTGVLIRACMNPLKESDKILTCFKFVVLGTLKGIVFLICSLADPIFFGAKKLDEKMIPNGRTALLIVHEKDTMNGIVSKINNKMPDFRGYVFASGGNVPPEGLDIQPINRVFRKGNNGNPFDGTLLHEHLQAKNVKILHIATIGGEDLPIALMAKELGYRVMILKKQ